MKKSGQLLNLEYWRKYNDKFYLHDYFLLATGRRGNDQHSFLYFRNWNINFN